MHVPGIDRTEAGRPPLRRAATGLLLGLLTGAAAVALLPRDPRPDLLPAVLERQDAPPH